MLFSLDVFEPGLSAQEIAIGLFMHNIPALILYFSRDFICCNDFNEHYKESIRFLYVILDVANQCASVSYRKFIYCKLG